MACTVFFEVLAAEIHDSWHLSVDGIEAELFVVALLPVAGCLNWQRQLEGLQEPRLVIIEVSDAIHRYSALSSRRVNTVHWAPRNELLSHASSTHRVNDLEKKKKKKQSQSQHNPYPPACSGGPVWCPKRR